MLVIVLLQSSLLLPQLRQLHMHSCSTLMSQAAHALLLNAHVLLMLKLTHLTTALSHAWYMIPTSCGTLLCSHTIYHNAKLMHSCRLLHRKGRRVAQHRNMHIGAMTILHAGNPMTILLPATVSCRTLFKSCRKLMDHKCTSFPATPPAPPPALPPHLKL